jgi:hypothetical protein
MNITHGRARFVFIFPRLKIVLKIPKIYVIQFVQSAIFSLKHKRFLVYWRYSVEQGEHKWLLFNGFLENIGEFLFFRKRKYPVLLKTYFSLFGLLNIQKLGKKLPDTIDIWHVFNRVGTNEEVDALWKDAHHFSENGNFFWEDERLQMNDYGSKKCHHVLDTLITIAKRDNTEDLIERSRQRIKNSLAMGISETFKN